MSFSRRRFLQIAGISAGAVGLRSFAAPRIANADDTGPHLFLACYFSGGWDQMLVLDPRDNTNAAFQKTNAYAANGSGIYPAYDLVQDTNVKAALTKHASGFQKAGGLTFGPAIPQSFLNHATDLSICRGVFMGTLGHDVGRRYFTTGKFPRGLAAAGSSLGSSVASAEGKDTLVPNLSIDTEAYNQDFPAYATPIPIGSAADLQNLLTQLGTPLAPDADAALHAFEQQPMNCPQKAMNAGGLVDLFTGSREKARSMVSSTAAAAFNFKIPAPKADIQAVFDAFGITKTADLTSQKGRAAIAAIALTQGISQAVSVEAMSGIDDHANWDETHATSLYNGFDAIGTLIAYLKATNLTVNGVQTNMSTWSRTTMLVFSEFARTPLLNGRGGRDHHIASSCVVAGPGIQGGKTIGGTSDMQLTALNCDYATGLPTPDDTTGVPLRPTDIHATLLQSMGLPLQVISNNSPVPIQALLK